MKKLLLISLTFAFISMLSGISLEDLKNIGLENNYSYQATILSEKSITAQKWNAYSAILPSVTVNGNLSDSEPGFETKSYSFNLNQPIFQGGTIWYGMNIAKKSEASAKLNTNKTKIEVLNEIENLYYSVLESQSQVKIAEDQYQRMSALLEKANTQKELGVISQTDFLQFQLDATKSESSLFQAENTYQIAIQSLQNYVNHQVSDLDEVNFDMIYKEIKLLSEQNSIDNIVASLSTDLQAKNYDLLTTRQSAEIAKSSLRISQLSLLPSISLSASKSWSKSEFDSNFEDSNSIGLNVSMSVLPFLDKGSKIMENKYNFKSVQTQLKDLESTISLQLISQVSNLITAAKNINISALSYEHAKALYEQSKVKYEVGDLSTTDLLNSSISLLNAETQLWSNRYQYLRLKANIMLLTGEEDNTKFNQKLVTILEEK